MEPLSTHHSSATLWHHFFCSVAIFRHFWSCCPCSAPSACLRWGKHKEWGSTGQGAESRGRLAAAVQAHPGSCPTSATVLWPGRQLHEHGAASPVTLPTAAQPQSLPFPGPAASPSLPFPPPSNGCLFLAFKLAQMPQFGPCYEGGSSESNKPPLESKALSSIPNE